MAGHDNRLLYLISRAVSRLKYYSIEKFSGGGVTATPSQMGILFLLLKKDYMTMSELSSLLDIDNSTITRLSDRLIRQGLVERARDDSDRRISKLAITDRGKAEGVKAIRIAKAINAEIRKGFTDEEIEIFTRVLESFFEKF